MLPDHVQAFIDAETHRHDGNVTTNWDPNNPTHPNPEYR